MRWRLKSPASRLFTQPFVQAQIKESSASLAFVRGLHRWPVNSPDKGPVMRKMFPYDDAGELWGVFCAWTVCSGGDQRKHQCPAPLAFVMGIQRSPVNSAHKGPVTRKMFPFDDVFMFVVELYFLGQHPENFRYGNRFHDIYHISFQSNKFSSNVLYICIFVVIHIKCIHTY